MKATQQAGETNPGRSLPTNATATATPLAPTIYCPENRVEACLAEWIQLRHAHTSSR